MQVLGTTPVASIIVRRVNVSLCLQVTPREYILPSSGSARRPPGYHSVQCQVHTIAVLIFSFQRYFAQSALRYPSLTVGDGEPPYTMLFFSSDMHMYRRLYI